ncbi:glycosyltransferase family 2 protein [Geodermatophilus sp. SYSU D01180]
MSITLPAFGDGPLLREAVLSVLAQDCGHWTLQVFDDGPEDATLAAWLGSLDPRVTYVRNEPRLGINRNFQRCLDAADAELVLVLGADDRLHPSFVRRMTDAALRVPTASMYQPQVQVIDEDGSPARPLADRLKSLIAPAAPQQLGGEDLAVSLLRGNWMYFPATVFRASHAQAVGFREGYDIVLDLDLYLRLLLEDGQLALVDEVLFDYRRHRSSLSSTERLTGSRFTEESDYFAEMAGLMQQRGWTRAAWAARAHLTSRLHALMLLPTAIATRNRDLSRSLVRHITRRIPAGQLVG